MKIGVLRRRWIFCFLFGITALSVYISSGAKEASAKDIEYTITDLGIDYVYSIALDINNSGEVVGYMQTNTGDDHAFLYSKGVMSDLGTLGGTFSRARAINDKGQVVGQFGSGGYWKAFLYKDGEMTDLGTFGGKISDAADMNRKGQIAVNLDAPAGTVVYHPLLYYKGTVTNLGTLGGVWAEAYGMNNSGEVVGISLISGNSEAHAFLYNRGVMTDLGTLGGSYSFAHRINDKGQVVGYSPIYGDSEFHAFLYSDGEMNDLGTLGGPNSYAYDINKFGHVVGWSGFPTGYGRAFLYKDGGMIDLNSLVKLPPGWILSEAYGINDSGQIVGKAVVNGYGHAVLMSPIHKPHHVNKPHRVDKPHHAAPLKEWVGGIGGYWEDED